MSGVKVAEEGRREENVVRVPVEKAWKCRVVAAEVPMFERWGKSAKPLQSSPTGEKAAPHFWEGLDGQAPAAPCPVDVIHAVSAVLEHLTSRGAQAATPFDGVRSPTISLTAYLERLCVHFKCSLECYVLAIILLDRAVELNKGLTVTALNVHRLFCTSLLVATKVQDDVYLSNAYYAVVAGVSLQEINSLEVTLLRLLQYRCMVKPEEYGRYLSALLNSS